MASTTTFRRYLDRRVLVMLALGFSSGLPLLLVLGTFSARLAFSNVDIKTIGLFSYLALPYSLKFLWSPAIDKLDPPGLTRLLGRRRAWMVVSQVAVAAALALMAFANPTTSLAVLGLGAFLVAFCAATQDVVIDGWRIDAAGSDMQGVMAATSNLGYRIALITAGALALVVADRFGWTAAYLAMAGCMAVGLVATLTAPVLEPAAPRSVATDSQGPHAKVLRAAEPRSTRDGPARVEAGLGPAPRHEAGRGSDLPVSQGEEGRAPAFSFRRAIVEPFSELYGRFGTRLWPILLAVALYRMPDFVSGVMANPLYRAVGFSLTEIAGVSKLYGIWVGIAASFVSGWAMARFGLYPTFVVGAGLAAGSHLSLSWLSAGAPELWRLVVAISIDNFGGAFAGTALIAYMSSLTSRGYAATQYALFSSLYALPGKLVAGSAGFLVAGYGFPVFFAGTAALGVPVVLLCLLVGRPIRRRDPVAAVSSGDPAIAPGRIA